ncbi:MAG: hypothetical protein GXO83_02290 [Chlorobi bacterium]|nr:hypothetical protein [Chlorobiota bacterium]
MNLRKAFLLAGYIFALGLTGVYLVSCKNHSMKGMLIFTRIPVDRFNPDGDGLSHDFPGSGLMAVKPGEAGGPEINLTPGFYSACSPQISYDATHLLFAGQKNEQDPWQVWEMDLKHKTSKQITDFKESCFGPAYLPGGRLVFSREMPDTGTGTTHTLFTMNLDGSNLQQITFHPDDDYVSTILRDGRILMLSKQIFPEQGEIKYLAMRPNGTKAQLFYQGEKGTVPGFRVYETADEHIYFIERKTGKNKKRDIISIRYNRPLHSRVNYTAEISGNFYTVLPLPSGDMFVSYRPSDNQAIALYHFSGEKKSIGERLFGDSKYHILDPVLVEPYNRPRKLPDELNLTYPTGLIVCQNVNITSLPDTASSSTAKTTKIEVLGLDKSLGIVPVEDDGSFYLKVTADLPFRIRALDDHDRVLYGPSDWIWVRPFERRGCVGCHEDPELVPENVVPLAIKTWPVLIPVDTTQSLKNVQTFKVSDMK